MEKEQSILVVDDKLINRVILRKIFESEYNIYEASDGFEAMDMLTKHDDIVVVLLDLVMPGMDGYEVMQKMSADEYYSTIPVITISVRGDTLSQVKAFESGAVDMIIKPFDPAVVKTRVTTILNAREQDRKRFNAVLLNETKYVAYHDSLTGIANRMAFCENTEEMLKTHPEQKYVIIELNIEHFRTINEVFGTETGDEVLIKIANELMNILGDYGTYGRLNADHFVACVPAEMYTEENILHLLEKLKSGYKVNLNMKMNIGVYFVENNNDKVSLMCDKTSLALKTINGDFEKFIAIYDDDMQRKHNEEIEIISDVNRALENQEFVIYFQPVYGLANMTPVSAEALVRWMHPNKGMISPGVFIPLLEKSGLILKLDEYVLDATCRFLVSQEKEGKKLLPISVNVSRRSLYNIDLSERIIEIVDSYKVEHSNIRIEITETAFNDNPKQLIETANKLKASGFMILLDDFGSGYSSLNALKDIPVDILKIDMKFMEGLGSNSRVGSILTIIVRMAKWLNMDTIAEGVETKYQVDFLKSIGCAKIQGYFFSRPLPQKDYDKLLVGTKLEIDIGTTFTIDEAEYEELFGGNNRISGRLLNGLFGGVSIYEYYENGRLELIRANDGYFDMMGYNPQSLLEDSNDVHKKLYQEDVQLSINACKSVINNKGTKQIVVRRYNSTGKLMYLNAIYRYLGTSGDHTLLCIALNDISGQKMTENRIVYKEQKIQKQSEYIESLFSTIPCGILHLTISDTPRIIYANNACAKIYGYRDANEMRYQIGMPVDTLYIDEDIQMLKKAFNDCRSNGKLVAFTAAAKKRDGTNTVCECKLDITENSLNGTVFQIVFLDNNVENNNYKKKLLSLYGESLIERYDEVLEFNYNTGRVTVVSRKNIDGAVDIANRPISRVVSLWMGFCTSETDKEKIGLLGSDESIRDNFDVVNDNPVIRVNAEFGGIKHDCVIKIRALAEGSYMLFNKYIQRGK